MEIMVVLRIIITTRFLEEAKRPYSTVSFIYVLKTQVGKIGLLKKLIDCMATKTVPIYWGCPNIEDWFDTRGFIVVNNFNDIIKMCNSLNENTYSEMIPYIESNFELSKGYIDLNDRIKTKIIEVL